MCDCARERSIWAEEGHTYEEGGQHRTRSQNSEIHLDAKIIGAFFGSAEVWEGWRIFVAPKLQKVVNGRHTYKHRGLFRPMFFPIYARIHDWGIGLMRICRGLGAVGGGERNDMRVNLRGCNG